MNTLIVLAGISSSGKSTYSLKAAEEWYAEVVSSDALRQELYGDVNDQSHNKTLFEDEIPFRLGNALARGNVIMDATSVSRWSRKHYVFIAHDLDCRVECHYITPNVERSIEWNDKRDRKVPINVIHRQAKQWETPRTDEGFDVVKEIVV